MASGVILPNGIRPCHVVGYKTVILPYKSKKHEKIIYDFYFMRSCRQLL
jgi:hypothetical protein